jgi:hypothetical protein
VIKNSHKIAHTNKYRESINSIANFDALHLKTICRIFRKALDFKAYVL